jgi:HlyD family secretion protein
MNPTTVQNVVTYDTIIEFANAEMKLFPGMTAYVTIPVANATNALKVPNAALRFRPATDANNAKPADANSANNAQQRRTGNNDPSLATVYKTDAKGQVTPVRVKLGITDHTFTEVAQVLSGELKPGDEVATGSAQTQKTSTASAAPGMGGATRGGGMRGAR